MIQKLNHHIIDNFSFLTDKKLLVACSGGLDSVVLTSLLKKLQFNISLAHCNFSLRGKESNADEKFVIKLADKLSVPILTKTFQTKEYAKKNGISTQMAARDLRYTWFRELLHNYSYDYLITAHHLDDALETFFINLSRGTGLRGLTGIPSINKKIVRPLLYFSREEIYKYAIENEINWREDSSNASTDYLRNKLRLEVIPKYKEIGSSVLEKFKETQDHLRDSLLLVEDYMLLINNLVTSKTKEGLQIDLKKLSELPNTNALLYELLKPFGFTAWEDIVELINAQTGKQIFSATHQLLKNRNVFLLSKKNIDIQDIEFEILETDKEIFIPIHLTIKKVLEIEKKNKNIAYFDARKLKFPLKLRKWSVGDIFFPFGMKGKKKLSKFFKDEKLSLFAKKNIWVLCSGNDIIWIVGMRSDNRYLVTDKTQEVIKITYKQ